MIPTDVELAHGYTLRHLDILVRIGIHQRAMYIGVDTDERYAAGYHSAAELLYSTDEPPTSTDLIRAARDAADYETRRTGEHRGRGRVRDDGSRSDGSMPKFWAYWDRESNVTHSHENGIVDRIALTQIWPKLTPAHREALQALAALEDYQAAADMLGLRYHTFCRRVWLAQNAFLRLWLEGETPGPRWRDRKVQIAGGKRQSMSSHVRRRARSGAAA
jgi:hypothetical protein